MPCSARCCSFPDVRDVAGDVDRLPGAEAITLATSDGETIKAWWKAPREPGLPVYLYLHGNGANLSRRAGRFQRMTDDGSGLLAVSWRGYGGSSGQPSRGRGSGAMPRRPMTGWRGGLSRTGWCCSANRLERVSPSGWQPAARGRCWCWTRPMPRSLILGRLRFPFLPVALLSRDPFRSIDLAPSVHIPVIAQHCTQDWVIPLSESLRLLARFSGQAFCHGDRGALPCAGYRQGPAAEDAGRHGRQPALKAATAA
jgi:uncharacterized protein